LKNQAGQALPMALILLVVGGLLVVPTLSLVSTTLNANRQTDRQNLELYAADAGVENMLWNVKNDPHTLPAEGTPNTINLQDQTINNMSSVVTTISNEGNRTYKITSIATGPGGHDTQVETYIKAGNLDLFNCALASPGDIYLKKDCVVDGDMYCGGTLTPADFEPTNGEVITEELEFPSDEENQAYADKYKAEAMLGGTHVGNLSINSNSNLGPLYITGNLNIGMNITVTLQGTIYVAGSITAQKDATFTGDGSIIAVGDIDVQKVSGYGTEGTSIIMSLTGDIMFKKECDVAAMIYAPEGSASFDKDANITGAVIAGEGIIADKEGTFTLNSLYYDTLELPGYGSDITLKSYAINP
jgi:hypothetical protein